jgi:hypothetical protein
MAFTIKAVLSLWMFVQLKVTFRHGCAKTHNYFHDINGDSLIKDLIS